MDMFVQPQVRELADALSAISGSPASASVVQVGGVVCLGSSALFLVGWLVVSGSSGRKRYIVWLCQPPTSCTN